MQTVNKKYIKKDYLSQSSIPPSPASRGEGLLNAELMIYKISYLPQDNTRLLTNLSWELESIS